MINNEYGLACSETLAILDNMDSVDINKIPKSFIDFLKNTAVSNNKVKFDINIPLTELQISQKTKELLGFMYITWWCNSDEKKKYKTKIIDYRAKQQELMREKYNPDKLFTIRNENINIEENKDKTSLIKYENTNKIRTIIRKILEFFKFKK